MPSDEHIRDKTKEEILAALYGGAHPGSVVFEQYREAIFVRSVEDIEKAADSLEQAIRDAASASSRLSGRLVWLNAILAIATVVGAFAALWSAFG